MYTLAVDQFSMESRSNQGLISRFFCTRLFSSLKVKWLIWYQNETTQVFENRGYLLTLKDDCQGHAGHFMGRLFWIGGFLNQFKYTTPPPYVNGYVNDPPMSMGSYTWIVIQIYNLPNIKVIIRILNTV